MRLWCVGIPIMCVISSAQAADAPMELVVFGPAVPGVASEPIGLFVDAAGHACMVESDGLSCVDDDGREVWGYDLEDLQDVRVADEVVLVRSGDTWMEVDEDGVSEAPAGEPVITSSGRLAWRQDGSLRLPDGSVESLANAVGDDVILHADGRIRVIDDEGALVSIDGEGRPFGSALDLEVGGDGWLLTEALPNGGVAALDEEGLVLVDADGRVIDVELEGDTMRVVDDGVWVAGEDGLFEVSSRGEVRSLYDAPVVDAAVDGDGWAVLDRGGRLRRFDAEDLPAGGLQHLAPVTRLAPDAAGGVVSIDADGLALHWDARGRPRKLSERARDAAWDGAGRLWLMTDDGLVRRSVDGAFTSFDLDGDTLVGLESGVIVGDGQRLRSVDGEGEVRWERAEAHVGLSRSGPILVSHDAAGVAISDVASGARRRRVVEVGREIVEVGVAVGGLVAVARAADGSGMVGFRPGREAKLSYVPESRALHALGPDGRWVVWVGDTLELRNLEGWPVLARASREIDERPRIVEARSDYVWVGLEDGRIERWGIADQVEDTEVPRFAAYAQLDAFVPAEPLESPPKTRGLTATALAMAEDGTVAIGPDLTLIGPNGAAVVESELELSAVSWDRDRGWMLGGTDGEIQSLGPGLQPSPLAELAAPVSDLCAVPQGLVVAGPASVVRLPDGGGAPVRLHTGAGRGEAPPRLACHSDGTVHIDLGDRIRSILPDGSVLRRVHPGGSRSLAVLPTGDLVSGGDDEVVIVWDPQRPQPVYVLEGHGAAVVDLDVSADGLRLVAGTAGAGAVVWDLMALAPVGRSAPEGVLRHVVMSDDGEVIHLAGEAGLMRVDLPRPASESVQPVTPPP